MGDQRKRDSKDNLKGKGVIEAELGREGYGVFIEMMKATGSLYATYKGHDVLQYEFKGQGDLMAEQKVMLRS